MAPNNFCKDLSCRNLNYHAAFFFVFVETFGVVVMKSKAIEINKSTLFIDILVFFSKNISQLKKTFFLLKIKFCDNICLIVHS